MGRKKVIELPKQDVKVYTEAPKVNLDLIREWNEVKKAYDQVKKKQQLREKRMKELRDAILADLPGKVTDKANITIDGGIVLEKWFRETNSVKGSVVLGLLKMCRVAYNKVAKREYVVDADKWAEIGKQLVEKGKLTQEEYDATFERSFTPNLTVKDLRTEEDLKFDIGKLAIDSDELTAGIKEVMATNDPA